ncbi:uncharacterized protein LOC127138225 [Lathyrus oleraceus]|uniref:uncharacterized protein LOC127138225 n=1 Tax=Pisum sativum TaxID=3888 RepID=UPI0021D241D0|nr:uncharacterized protein LOC127138225 [Pisum sativum]
MGFDVACKNNCTKLLIVNFLSCTCYCGVSNLTCRTSLLKHCIQYLSPDKHNFNMIFKSRSKVLVWTQDKGKQYDIIIVIVRSDTANGKRCRKDKLIMGCKRGVNYKRNNTSKSSKSSKGIYSMKVKCPFRLRSTLSGSGWKMMVMYGFHNNKLSKDLDGHDILGRLKVHERQFVNDMTKYIMDPQYIVSALKDKDSENLTSVTQVYKSIATYNASKRGPLMEMQILLTLIHREKYMCWARNKEDSNVVGDIF